MVSETPILLQLSFGDNHMDFLVMFSSLPANADAAQCSRGDVIVSVPPRRCIAPAPSRWSLRVGDDYDAKWCTAVVRVETTSSVAWPPSLAGPLPNSVASTESPVAPTAVSRADGEPSRATAELSHSGYT